MKSFLNQYDRYFTSRQFTRFDLLISQYAGFVSRAGKKYLRPGGILVANDSHGDASMANLDEAYELIAVADQTGDVWQLATDNLDKYFMPKKGDLPTVESLEQSGVSPKYTQSAANYIFQKVS